MTTTTAQRASLPDGPSFRPLTTVRILKNPEHWLQEWKGAYGDPFLVHTFNGRVVVTGDPAEIKKIFAAPPDTFEVFAPHATRSLLGETTLIGTNEPRHMRDRKLLMPPFHGDRMRAYADAMVQATENAIAPHVGTDTAFSFLDVAQTLSMDIIMRSVFGIDRQDEREAHGSAIRDAIESINPIFIFVKAFQAQPFGLGPFAKFKRLQAVADERLQAHIDALRGKTEGRTDILSMLLDATYDDGEHMSDDEVKDQLRTLLTAGHETTAFALTWALYCYFKFPEEGAALVAEIDANRELSTLEAAKLPRLNAYIKETLRLYPPLTEVLRLLRKPLEVAGHLLEPGVAVAPCVTLVHLNPDLYPDPHAFKAERFMGDRTYGPHEYLPFGGGHRRCIGAAFANMELACALFTLLRDYRFERTDSVTIMAKREHLTMSPDAPLNVRATRRADVR